LKGLIVFDMDGTLVEESSSWNLVYRAYGIEKRAMENFATFCDGKIDYEGLVRRTVEDLRVAGANRQGVLRALSSYKLKSGGIEAVSKAASLGWRAAIVSAGLCPLAQAVGSALGIGIIRCNDLKYDDEGRVLGAMVQVDPGRKWEAVRDVMSEVGTPELGVVTVGDHPMDGSMFMSSDHFVVIGAGPLEFLDTRGARVSSLKEIPGLIEKWYGKEEA